MSAEDILKRVVFHESSNLHLLGSTESFVNLVELLSSARLGELLSLARRDFDYVILDSPPVGYFADSELLAELADVSVLVIRQDVVPAPYINDAIDALNAGKAKLLGCVLNDMNSFALTGGAYGYGYGYGYGQYGKYGKYGKSSKSEAKGE